MLQVVVAQIKMYMYWGGFREERTRICEVRLISGKIKACFVASKAPNGALAVVEHEQIEVGTVFCIAAEALNWYNLTVAERKLAK